MSLREFKKSFKGYNIIVNGLKEDPSIVDERFYDVVDWNIKSKNEVVLDVVYIPDIVKSWKPKTKTKKSARSKSKKVQMPENVHIVPPEVKAQDIDTLNQKPEVVKWLREHNINTIGDYVNHQYEVPYDYNIAIKAKLIFGIDW